VNAPQHVAVRLDEETIARVEALVPRIAHARHDATRSDVLGLLVAASLPQAERDPAFLPAMLKK
jgi:hypothetical protein